MAAPWFEFSVRGHLEASRRVREIRREWPKHATRAMGHEGNVDLREMKRRTPVKTGDLQESGHVSIDQDLVIQWIFGGGQIDYAIPVHEDLDAIHPVGQAKYVESVVNESARTWGSRIANRAHLERMRLRR